MLSSKTQAQSCSSLSAPTPRGGQCGKMGKTKVVPSRRFRRTLSFTSPCGFTRDASAHESAAVRRHFAPGATGSSQSYCGLCLRLGRFGGIPLTVGIRCLCEHLYHCTPALKRG